MEISKDRQEFIEAHFNEVGNPTRKEFEQLTTSAELHYVAYNHNWDSGVEVLQWIAESNLCSEATALMIFWRAQPEEYIEYSWNAKKFPKYVEVEVFNLIRTIVENFKKGFYKNTDISYDPKEDMPESDTVPEIMLQATNGEEPYIYYDEKEVASWFGEHLDNRISRCDNEIDLFNIGALLKYKGIEIYKKVLNHPLCDKGIALMLFWRLRNYASLYGIEEISKDIIRKIENCAYREVLKYDPKEDIEIKIQRKAKWTIPNEMKKAINR
jgi:hypothetical protein